MDQGFEAGMKNIQQDKPLPRLKVSCFHVLIGDEAFFLKPYLLRPFLYVQSRLNPHNENYNIRLCKAPRLVENALGILLKNGEYFLDQLQLKLKLQSLLLKELCFSHFFRVKQCYN